VCDLETSRMGAPYIYDISHLRVKQPSAWSIFGWVTAEDNRVLFAIDREAPRYRLLATLRGRSEFLKPGDC